MSLQKNTLILVAALTTSSLFSNLAVSAEPMLSTGGYATQLQKMEMMKMIDADGNHMVTSAEADAYYNSIFDALDKDHDGIATSKEWAGPSGKSKLDLATGGYSRELRSMKMMGMMDKDGDHQVTKEEFLTFQKTIFAHTDKSGDGEIDAKEWVAKHVAG